MVKIMRPVQNLSLRKSLVLYIVLFVMFALALSIMTASVCETVADKINEKYPNTGEKYYLTNEQGERLGEGTYIYKELPVLNEQDEQLLAILDLLPTVTPPIYSAFCIIAAALLFYKNKLKKPLAELRAASEKIANNDLDFSIDYDSNDELCSFARPLKSCGQPLRIISLKCGGKLKKEKHSTPLLLTICVPL